MMDPVDEQVAVVGQYPLALGQPLAAPGEPVRVSVPLQGNAEFRAKVVWRVGDDQLRAASGQRSEQGDAVALVNLVQPGDQHVSALPWPRCRSLRMTMMFWWWTLGT